MPKDICTRALHMPVQQRTLAFKGKAAACRRSSTTGAPAVLRPEHVRDSHASGDWQCTLTAVCLPVASA